MPVSHVHLVQALALWW